MQLTAVIKYALYRAGFYQLADQIAFRGQQWKYRTHNQLFTKRHPSVVLPPDYWLYETFRLDYKAYITEGELAAREITLWTQPYFNAAPETILDWGCGCGRITRYLQDCFQGSAIHGCDLNPEYISWNKTNLPGIHFQQTDALLPYPDQSFDLIIGFSVLTHITVEEQHHVLHELHRVLTAKGICILTTHGAVFYHQLSSSEKDLLHRKGMYTRPGYRKGHRSVTTWHKADHLRQFLENSFEILEYHSGNINPEKTGSQDLWILRKK
jgi:ubiquinone/menaquinone biosynthesis C-methylase UbiE